MAGVPLSLLGVVFVAWLLGVAVVLAVLKDDLEEARRDGGHGDQEERQGRDRAGGRRPDG